MVFLFTLATIHLSVQTDMKKIALTEGKNDINYRALSLQANLIR